MRHLQTSTRQLVILLCSIQFIDVLGVTLFNVALPVIQQKLGTSDAQISMIAGIYALGFGSLLIPAGRIADLAGQRRMLLAGLVIFLISSLLGGVAASGHTVLIARALQGIAAASAVPAALSLLQQAVPDGRERNAALGIWTATGAVGGASGFAIGGLLTDTFGWRSLFLISVPLILGALVMTFRTIPAVRTQQPSSGTPAILPLVLLPAGLALLINGITSLQNTAFSANALLQIGIGPLLLWFSFRSNAKADNPLIPATVLHNIRLLTAAGVAATITFVTSGIGTLMSFWLQDVFGLRPLRAGLLLMLMSIGVVIGSQAGSAALNRLSRRQVMTAGLVGLAVASALLIVGIDMADLWILGAGLVFAGICLGWTSVGATAFGLSTITEDVRGIASGVLSAAAPIGTAIGIALLLTVARLGESMSGHATRGMQTGIAVSVVPILVALLAMWRTHHVTSHDRCSSA